MSIAEPPDRPAESDDDELEETGEVDDDPNVERTPPIEWVERDFLDDTDDITDDTHDDVEEVDTT